MTISCLPHADIIMPSAIGFELLNLRGTSFHVAMNVTPEHQTLITHTCVEVWTRDYSQMLCCSWPLHLNCLLNFHLRHPYTFAYSQAGRTFCFFFDKLNLPPPYHKSISTPSFHDYMFSFGIHAVCITLLHKPEVKALILVSVHLLTSCLQF